MHNLENLATLKNDMKAKGWTIASFLFLYKGIRYVVLVKRFVEPIRRYSKYADLKDNYIVEANSNGLLDEPKKIREYFGIEYHKNIGNLMKQFAQNLNKAVPIEVPDPNSYDKKQVKCCNRSLSNSDSENPNKIYCYGTLLNPEGKERSPFNADKTKIYRSELFEKLKDEPRLSFCYSADKSMEKSDSEILVNINKDNK